MTFAEEALKAWALPKLLADLEKIPAIAAEVALIKAKLGIV